MSSVGPVVSEKMFENVDGRRTDEGRRSHWYTISSPMSLPKCHIFFPKIAGKGPEYTACKYIRQVLANTDSSVNMQLIFTFYKILFLTKLGKIIKFANL